MFNSEYEDQIMEQTQPSEEPSSEPPQRNWGLVIGVKLASHSLLLDDDRYAISRQPGLRTIVINDTHTRSPPFAELARLQAADGSCTFELRYERAASRPRILVDGSGGVLEFEQRSDGTNATVERIPVRDRSIISLQISPLGEEQYPIEFQFHSLKIGGRKVLEFFDVAPVRYYLSTFAASGKFLEIGSKKRNVYAIRAMTKANGTGWNTRINEILFMKKLSSGKDNARHYLRAIADYFVNVDRSIDIVLEPFEGTTLGAFLELRESLSERLTKHLMLQLCQGVAYVHRQLIVHNNVDLTTILVDSKFPPQTVKISGFENASAAHPAALEVQPEGPGYAKPEVSAETYYEDRYACGIVAWKCMAGMTTSVYAHVSLPENDFCNYPSDNLTLRLSDLCTIVVGYDKEGQEVHLSTMGCQFIEELTMNEWGSTFERHSWLQGDNASFYRWSDRT
ncbi:Protein kinase domain-containing protein [Mycena indigotica]|uniref:Protein kinase domain-containing protein n=1 Tax=Mycena indigotica TaxID=2126181 RepID=A0A8H6WIA6_9AGAR|nr:Protein kinase domain-containing protein [Mycena indigotica]KAF7315918.1 Protein kinase domain-containing protein [Mycena indigotica]